MFYRQTYIQDNYTLGDSGTRTMDINVTDPITALWIKFQCTNGATSNKANTLAECISAIEIIDGADVVYSLDGAEALALAAYQLGYMPRQELNEVGGDVFSYAVPILFGRYLGDSEYAFDPARFVNPQLRVSWNLATVRAVGATGFAGSNLQISVVAHVMEGAPSPGHVLMPKEIYTWTSAAAGTEYIDLPTDYPYRGMLCRGLLANNRWHWMWDQIRINCDGGKFIAMNQRGWDVINQQSMFLERFHYRHGFRLVNGDTIQCLLKDDDLPLMTLDALADSTVTYSNAGWGSGAVALFTNGAGVAALTTVYAEVTGYNPYGCLYLPFGIQDTPGDWFPAPTFRGVKLEVRGGVADAAMYVCLVQDRSY